MWIRSTVIVLLLALLSSRAYAQAYVPDVVHRSADENWSVEDLGEGVFLFRWWPGLYVSPFLVGDDGVIAVDPISRDVAPLYREAVAAVTDKPIVKVVYSHDHRDHIVGADRLAPDAEVVAHPLTLASLQRRGDKDIPLPTTLVNDGDTIDVGERSISVHYFGPNHGDSNIALVFQTGMGRMLVFVDTLEIGIVPYRTLPDTNVGGYMASLRGAAALQMDWVLGGHSGPGPAVWISNYLAYFTDMERALVRARAEVPPQPTSDDVTDLIAAGERHTDVVIARAMEDLRPKYGSWRGFEHWAPLNAQTVLMYIITGN